ncbi:hypothetical protein M413DRAFT_440881 [Hebeloma cylindrosporum]|uniref:NCA2-domain-containing protein n=1 Tax=Hebeloma cylindrosporum TaxID=76867 RepID=A0A0C3CAI3_HEBCY|nr:hypothetical protein M413DRAFT_440881 [Hebeloma cylindrosporum h7]
MPSEFVDHYTRVLAFSASRPVSPGPSSQSELSLNEAAKIATNGSGNPERKARLHALLVSLNQNTTTPHDVQQYTRSLRAISHPVHDDANITGTSREDSAPFDPEELAMERAIIGKLTVALYSAGLETYLAQATEVEPEAEWWADVEGSRVNVALYLLQTLPLRLVNVMKTVLEALRESQLPVRFSSLSPSSLRSVFRSPSHFTLRAGLITTAFFPQLKNQQSLTLAVLLPPSRPSNPAFVPTEVRSKLSVALAQVSQLLGSLLDSADFLLRFAALPLELTKQECRYNRRALEKIRDDRAEVLGELASLRAPLSDIVRGDIMDANNLAKRQYTSFLGTLARKITPQANADTLVLSSPLTDLAQMLPPLDETHTQQLRTQRLLRPSSLTRLWPSLLFFPPLSLYIYTSRTSWVPALVDMARDAKETVHGFVRGWLVEPLVDVLKTVRTGGKGEVLVREEGVVADLESLKRMTLSLARDALNYTPSQLELLAEQVKTGDLTAVMQLYEEDIRTPLRSALRGTPVRNAFIQVQKAKVDIDQALSGIDRLLKSQELTFAFVGVAPALAVVWVVIGGLGRMWSVSRGRGSWGGKKKRRGVWERMRRIERLLIMQPPALATGSVEIAPLPTGLLILSLTRLRSYALSYLPPSMMIPFLEDLDDLEDTKLGREAKLRVVERMWRCWGARGEGVFRF